MHSEYFKIVSELVKSFKPVELTEMENVRLMDRTDMKFVLSFEILPAILEMLSEIYKILAIQQRKIFSYRNEYFDTPELSMYSDHHNGKLNRFKVRHRQYI